MVAGKQSSGKKATGVPVGFSPLRRHYRLGQLAWEREEVAEVRSGLERWPVTGWTAAAGGRKSGEERARGRKREEKEKKREERNGLGLLPLPATAATGLTFHAFDPNSLSDDILHGVVRSSRAISTIALTAVDYKLTLRGLPVDSDEYRGKLSEVHSRSAWRILKLCEANKGFYVKAGQFVAALRQVPKEYSSTLSSLQDQAVPCHFKAIEEVLIRNLGHKLSDTFMSLDEQPLAAASIA
ncbi:hypothetical protein ACLB2K_006986 [Fragaria x ananassa]